MSQLAIKEWQKDNYLAALTLHALIIFIREQETLFQENEGLLKQYQEGNPAVCVLINSLREQVNFEKGTPFEGLDLTKEDNFNLLIEIADTRLVFLHQQLKGYFDISILPFLNWQWVVQSVQTQRLTDRTAEEVCFNNFLNYQNRAIEAFIKERIEK